jgi:hypothetical protein
LFRSDKTIPKRKTPTAMPIQPVTLANLPGRSRVQPACALIEPHQRIVGRPRGNVRSCSFSIIAVAAR